MLYPSTLREIEEPLVQCPVEDTYGVWNEFVEPFEVSDKTVRRRLNSLQDEMPIGCAAVIIIGTKATKKRSSPISNKRF